MPPCPPAGSLIFNRNATELLSTVNSATSLELGSTPRDSDKLPESMRLDEESDSVRAQLLLLLLLRWQCAGAEERDSVCWGGVGGWGVGGAPAAAAIWACCSGGGDGVLPWQQL